MRVPVNIGKWQTYQFFTDKEQLDIQRQNLEFLSLEDCSGDVCFIFSSQIKRMNDMLENLESQVTITGTETVIEDEIYYTSKIEGATTSRVRTSEIHNGRAVSRDNEFSERMVKNGFDAVKYINLHPGQMSADLIVDTWNILTDGACQNEEIRGERFRSGPIYVGSYEGAKAERIECLMDKWVAFYNGPELSDVPFIKAAIMHYVFESIHPFCDGNGRMGRLLLNNFLINHGKESAKAVSFSMAIDRRRAAYDAALADADNIYRDCTPLVEYMMEVYLEAYGTALEIQGNIRY